MGAFATRSQTGATDITGSGTANQVAVFTSAQAIGNPTISFTSGTTGFVIGSTTLVEAALLTLTSTTQGLLPPRMTTVQRDAIASPVAGLMVYDSTLETFAVRTSASGVPQWAGVITTKTIPLAFAANGVLYASSTTLAATSAKFIFDGTNLTADSNGSGTDGYLYVGAGFALLGAYSSTGYSSLVSGTTNPLQVILNKAGQTITINCGTTSTFTVSATTLNIGTASTAISIGTITTGVWNGTAIGATYGGTGQTVYAIGDLLYASTTTALSKLAAGAAGAYLRFAGVGVAPIVSTLILPNAATVNQIVYASATNTYGASSLLTFDGTIFTANALKSNASGAYVGSAVATSSILLSITSTQNASTNLTITNADTGTAARGEIALINSAGTSQLALYGSGYTTSGIAIQNAFSLLSNAAGGITIGNYNAAGVIRFFTGGSLASNQFGNISATGKWFLGGSTTATAWAHLAAGTATASTAPLKFTSGTNLTTAEAGACEYDGTYFYKTASSAIRKKVVIGLQAAAALDFPSTAAGTISDLTITVTGAALGDTVLLGVPNASVAATSSFFAWVSAANTVTIRHCPNGVIADPASGTFSVTVVTP